MTQPSTTSVAPAERPAFAVRRRVNRLLFGVDSAERLTLPDLDQRG